MKIQNQTQFTSGPWSIEDNRLEKGISHYAISAGEDMICSVSPMHLKRAEDVANAQLISAAPELLAALQDLLYNPDYQTRNTARELLNKIKV